MSLTLPKICSMGSSQTGLVGTVGVTLLTFSGTVHTARATTGIYEIGGGCYGKNISFPDNWAGSIKWDTGGGSPVYACEEYVVDGLIDAIQEDLDNTNQYKADTSNLALTGEYDTTLSGIQNKVDDNHDEAFGKWVLDPTAKTLTLYKSNNVTVLKVFDLTDTAANIPAFIARTPQ